MSDRCAFDICDGGGLIFDELTNTAYDCRCRPQLIARRRATSLSSVIPKKYRYSSFDRQPVIDMDDAVVRATKRYVDSIDAQLDRGHGLWLMGPPGTGKTTLAMIVSKAAITAGRSVAIYSLPRLLNEIRDTYREERSHVHLLDSLAAVDLLHIDDLGAERRNDWVIEELYSIVNSRYEQERSIVITSNVGEDALREQITPRTVSRLMEMCDAVLVAGPDRREERTLKDPSVLH